MIIKKDFPPFIQFLGSVQLTLISLGLLMVLIFWGTLAQANMGTFHAQKLYFNSFWLYGPTVGGIRIPVFPGGLSIGLLWLVNLIVSYAFRFRMAKRDIGLYFIHFGLIVLVAGQGITQLTAKESRMAIEEGQTLNFIERSDKVEMAFTMTSEPDKDQVIAIPYSIFSNQKEIQSDHLPFSIQIKEFFHNSHLQMSEGGSDSMATKGIGPQISVQEIPFTTRDDEINNVTAFVELIKDDKSLGIWLLAMSLAAPQEVTVDGKNYRMAIRAKREFLPFTITLNDFRHDKYPGTDIPKNFSSQIHLDHPEKSENRDILIYMNHPLRYGGYTFFQASFGKNDTLSVFQVVENPVWLTPYIAVILTAIGLIIQFSMHLTQFSKRRV